jgi:aminoglycoside phosphotransferase (APT) family kinase protein
MKSLTKNKQDEKMIRDMTKKYFHNEKLVSFTELTEGYFNVAYEIKLSNGKSVILKIAPTENIPVMSYEKNIMYSEVEAMRKASEFGIPVPKVYGFDNSCSICSAPYFFMEKLKGCSLNSIKDTYTAEETQQIYFEMGKINKKINDIICPYFGYPGQPDIQGMKWYEVFHKMIEMGIADAEDRNIDIKISKDELCEKLEKDRELFEEVKVPKLVHWDCWDGNIFVDKGRITGIIDWERSIFADPLMEVGFRTYGDNTYFQKGYGITGLTESQRIRALWYDIYQLILISLECEYRQYETMDLYHWSSDMLLCQFNKIWKENR